MKEQGRTTIFDWHAHDRSLVRLGLAAVMTVSAIVGMFIVFRVVTPETRTVDVRPQRVMILNPDVPAERALIHQAMDKSFGLLPSDPSVTAPVKLLKRPVFTPSYAREELKLKPLPSGLTQNAEGRMYALDMDILPPLPTAPRPGKDKPVPQVLRAVFQGDAAGRSPASTVIPGVALADSLRPRFQVGIGRQGQVLMALPLILSDDPAINQKLHHAITQMKFSPAGKATGPEVEWGQVFFQWVPKEEAAP